MIPNYTLILAIQFQAYEIPSSVMSSFIANATTASPQTLSGKEVGISCSMTCLAARNNIDDFATCNSYIVEGGICYLDYIQPSHMVPYILGIVNGTKLLYSDIVT